MGRGAIQLSEPAMRDLAYSHSRTFLLVNWENDGAVAQEKESTARRTPKPRNPTRYFLRIKTFSRLLFPKISFSEQISATPHTQIFLSDFSQLLSTVPGTVVLV